MTKFRTSTLIMAACSVLMLIGLFLPYVKSTTADISLSIFDVLGGSISELVAEKSKSAYVIVGGGVGVCALFGLLSLTSKKIFGVFAIILSLIVALFHGAFIAMNEDRSGVALGMGFWLILAGSVVLLVASILFVARKNRSVALAV